MPHPLSLAALTILDVGPAGQIRAAAEAGWRSVGLRLMPLLPTDPAIVGDWAMEAEVVRLLKEKLLEVLEIGVFPVKAEMDWPAIEAVINFSAGLGARHIVCPVEDADPHRRLATYRRLCDLVAPRGLTALVEFNPYSACTSLAEAVRIVEAAQHESAGLVIDVLHLSRSGGSPEDLTRVDQRLIQLVHLCDAAPPPPSSRSVEELRRESRTARLLPGEGDLWLTRLLEVLPPDVPLSVEAPSARYAHLAAAERARRALVATEKLIAAHHRSG